MTDIEQIREALTEALELLETEGWQGRVNDDLKEATSALDRLAAQVGATGRIVTHARYVWDAATFGNLHKLSNSTQALGEAIQALDALSPPPETADGR